MEHPSVQIAVNLALGLTCLMGLGVGARTLGIWWRTRQFAELAMGLNVATVAAGGALMVGLENAPGVMGGPYGRGLWTLAFALLGVHAGAIFFGTWRIFRSGRRWPATLCVPVVVAMAVYVAWAWRVPVGSVERGILYEGVRLVGFGWLAVECFRYGGLLRRRAKLGLGDEVVAHRLWLWGLASASQLVVSAHSFISGTGWGIRAMDTASGLLVTSVVGLFGATCIALAFFPPAAYSHWVASRHGSSLDRASISAVQRSARPR